MKRILLILTLTFACKLSFGQKIESIYFNLYTDSLKKGTYNYINVDGKFSNGKYLPLDSSEVIFKSSHGKFYGNSLWIEPDCKEEKVHISLTLKANQSHKREFDMYLKRNEDPAKLKTVEELMDEMNRKSKQRKG